VQPYVALGAGLKGRLTVERLAGAIRAAVGDTEMRERAAELGWEIRVEKGVERAVGIIEGGEQ
jgi:UDP:flavonoid glycosyltransferase YjiC (YdhE family)